MFYIGKRVNPQLSAPYYMALGKMTKKAAAGRERPVYGSVFMTGYKTEAEYNTELQKLRDQGHRVV